MLRDTISHMDYFVPCQFDIFFPYLLHAYYVSQNHPAGVFECCYHVHWHLDDVALLVGVVGVPACVEVVAIAAVEVTDQRVLAVVMQEHSVSVDGSLGKIDIKVVYGR